MATSVAQHKFGFTDGANAALSFTSTPAAGGLVVACVTRFASSSPSLVAGNITDNQGNTYALIANVLGDSTDAVAMYYAKNVKASGTFTVTCAPSTVGFGIVSVTGADRVNPLIGSSSASGSSVTPSPGAISAVTPGSIVMGVAWSLTDGDTWAAGSGYTLLDSDTNNSVNERFANEYQIAGAATSYTPSFTVGVSSAWGAVGAAFRAAAPAAPSTNRARLIRSSCF